MTNKIDEYFNDFRQSIKIDEKEILKRENKLKTELIKRFGEEYTDFLTKTILGNSIKYAVSYYLIGRPAMVYIELHAVLERTAILILPQLLSGPKLVCMCTKERLAIENLLNRKQLSDLVETFKIIEVWDSSDENKVNNLISKRNGIAHHNPKIISKQFNSGKSINSARINEVVEKDKNTHIVLVDTIELIDKIISKE